MEPVVIEEDVVSFHVLLQDFTRCSGPIIRDVRAKNTRICRWVKMDFGCSRHT